MVEDRRQIPETLWETGKTCGNWSGAGDPPAGPPPGLSYAHICSGKKENEKLKGAERGEFRLSIPLNAGCLRLVEVGEKGRPVSDHGRGTVKGFSPASRLRLLEVANSIDRSAVAETWFLTLTVPAGEGGWAQMEKWRRAYAAALQERWGLVGWCAVWKKEPQKNGTPHLHLMLYWLKGRPVPKMEDFRAWNDNAWADVVKSLNPHHRKVGCRVERMYSWNGTAFYTGKYFTKVVDGEAVKTGRIWGRINADQFPEHREEQVVSAKVGKRMRRILRKLQQRKRSRILAWVDGGWRTLRAQKILGHVHLAGGESREVDHWRQPSEQAAVFSRAGGKIKVIRPKVCRTKERAIWAQDVDSYKLQQVSTEDHSFCSSLHFVQSGTALRLLALLERQEQGDGLPRPPDDGIPF